MDVGAYSSQNLISPYLTGAQSRPRGTEDQQGLRPGRKDAARGPEGTDRPQADDEQVRLPSEAVRQADRTQIRGAADPTGVNSTDLAADPTNDTKDAQARAAREQQVRELQTTDREVRSHEAAAGRYGGAVSFDYEKGPNGRLYAVGGEVGIDISSESTPDATIAKMRQVQAAAMAPANPSAQDRAVAAAANAKGMQAARELQSKEQDESTGIRSADINSRAGAYQKNGGMLDAPAPTGRQEEATGFQDTGLIKAGDKKGISTLA